MGSAVLSETCPISGGKRMKSVEKKVAPSSEYFIYTPSKTAQKLYFYPIQCGIFVYEPGYSLTRESYDSFLLMHIPKGMMELEICGKRHTVKENSFVLIDCYQPHRYSTQTGYECTWIHFDGPLAREYYELIVSRLGNVFTIGDAFPVLRKMTAILEVFFDHTSIHEPLLSKYFTDIFTILLLHNPENSATNRYASMVERAITYIGEHYSENIPIERLSAMSGLSVYYFIRVFRQETGYTPHEYIISRRMASARYLLKCTELTTKEICFSTGFSSESVFCNAFRKLHGMSPQSYRLHGATRVGDIL